MLSKVLNGWTESDLILLTLAQGTSPTHFIHQLQQSTQGKKILISVLPPSQHLTFAEVIDLSEILRATDVIPGLAEAVPTSKFSGCDLVVIESVTDLLALYSPAQVGQLLLRVKQSVRTCLAVLHRGCVEDFVISELEPLASTCIELTREDEKRTYPKTCSITHRKPGGKIVRSKEVLKVDEAGKVVVEEYRVAAPALQEAETEEPADATINKLTTFNLGIKQEEAAARSDLVLPFFTDEQKSSLRIESEAGEVKLQRRGQQPQQATATIHYDPDSGDDWDDEDPDDDLDI